jgi:hypothetical protein
MTEATPPRILFCGSRDWTDRKAIADVMKLLPKGTVIIEGEAPGADSIAREEALRLGFIVVPFEANWKKFGRAAGPIRNARMLDQGRPDAVVAFHDDIEASKGTKNMLKQAREAGLPTFLNPHGALFEFVQWLRGRGWNRLFQDFLEDPQSFENLESLQGDDY